MIPPSLLVRGGEFDENVLGLILGNVRTPAETGGDLRAQVAGVNIGTRRFLELVEKFGLGQVLEAMGEVLDYTERRVRRAFAEMPRGVFEAEGFMDDDGFAGE